MINTIFYFVDDETFDYAAAIELGVISPYTIVFDKFDKTIRMGGVSYGQMNRADIAASLGNISDLLPVATDTALGAIKVGYASNVGSSNRNYGVQLDEHNRAYVAVPWTDTVTPVFDDSALRDAIDVERRRIDAFTRNLATAVQEKVEDLLDDAQWVEDNLTEGEFGGQSTDTVEELLKMYSVWNWADPNDHSKGKDINITKLQASVLGLQGSVGNLSDNMAVLGTLEIKVNGEYTLVVEAAGTDTSGAIEISTISTEIAGLESVADGDTFRTKSFDTVPASNAIYKKGSTYFHFVKSDNLVDSNTTLTNSISLYGDNFDKLVKMAASTLGLKTSKNGNLLTTMADLASVITTTPDQDGKYFTGYSGLSTTVKELSDGMSAHSSLLSTITKSTDPDDANYGKLSDSLMAGIASDLNVSGTISTAQTNLITAINNKTAGINVMVTKNATTGAVDSGITLSADQVIIDANQTSFKSAVGAFVKTDVLEAGNATFSGTLDGVDGNFSGSLSAATGTFKGRLSGATGTFKGEVQASKFIAGDQNGTNITVEDDNINFNVASQKRAWFSPYEYTISNGEITKSSNVSDKGFYLYIIDTSGNLRTIDFTNGTFVVVGAVNTPVIRKYLYSVRAYDALNSPNAVVQNQTLYTVDDNGIIKYYTDSNYQSATPMTSDNSASQPNTASYYDVHHNIYETAGNDYDWAIMKESNGVTDTYRLYQVVTYEWCTFSNGVMTRTGKYVMIAEDPENTSLKYMVTPCNSSSTITSPNTTVYVGSGQDHIDQDVETSINSNTTLTTYCIQKVNSIQLLSGTVSLFACPGNDGTGYMTQHNFTFSAS